MIHHIVGRTHFKVVKVKEIYDEQSEWSSYRYRSGVPHFGAGYPMWAVGSGLMFRIRLFEWWAHGLTCWGNNFQIAWSKPFDLYYQNELYLWNIRIKYWLAMLFSSTRFFGRISFKIVSNQFNGLFQGRTGPQVRLCVLHTLYCDTLETNHSL